MLWAFFSEGTSAVRFQQLRWANAMRSQTNDAAKSGRYFLVHAFDFLSQAVFPAHASGTIGNATME